MRTNHYVSPTQIEVVNLLLHKLNDTIIEKSGNDVMYSDIKVLGSDYTPDVFIHFEKTILKDDGEQLEIYWKITPEGELDDDALHNMYFKEISDRVHFFDSLFEIKIV